MSRNGGSTAGLNRTAKPVLAPLTASRLTAWAASNLGDRPWAAAVLDLRLHVSAAPLRSAALVDGLPTDPGRVDREVAGAVRVLERVSLEGHEVRELPSLQRSLDVLVEARVRPAGRVCVDRVFGEILWSWKNLFTAEWIPYRGPYGMSSDPKHSGIRCRRIRRYGLFAPVRGGRHGGPRGHGPRRTFRRMEPNPARRGEA